MCLKSYNYGGSNETQIWHWMMLKGQIKVTQTLRVYIMGTVHFTCVVIINHVYEVILWRFKCHCRIPVTVGFQPNLIVTCVCENFGLKNGHQNMWILSNTLKFLDFKDFFYTHVLILIVTSICENFHFRWIQNYWQKKKKKKDFWVIALFLQFYIYVGSWWLPWSCVKILTSSSHLGFKWSPKLHVWVIPHWFLMFDWSKGFAS